MNDIIENVKGVMNNTKEKFSGSLQFVRETNTEKGTVLRNQLATARTELNDKLHEAEVGLIIDSSATYILIYHI